MVRKSPRATKLLNEMRRNPKSDWRIEQLDTVARAYEVNVRQSRGSHVVFEHPKLPGPVSAGPPTDQASLRTQIRRPNRGHRSDRDGRVDAERRR